MILREPSPRAHITPRGDRARAPATARAMARSIRRDGTVSTGDQISDILLAKAAAIVRRGKSALRRC